MTKQGRIPPSGDPTRFLKRSLKLRCYKKRMAQTTIIWVSDSRVCKVQLRLAHGYAWSDISMLIDTIILTLNIDHNYDDKLHQD